VVARDGKLAALRCAKMQLGEPDASGRRRPVEIPGAEEEVALDTLVVAISQKAELAFFDGEAPRTNRQGYLDIDPATGRTSLDRVYAGGDVVLEGPSTIVKAVGDGKRIAQDIRRREEGLEQPLAKSQEADLTDLLIRRARRQFRVAIPEVEPALRRNFEEVVQTLDPEAARREAARCIDCHLLCSQCVAVCPNMAFLTYRQKPLAVQLPRLVVRGGQAAVERGAPFQVSQRFQVAVLTDFCNECGNCETFCPTAGAPYRDKPRLYVDRAEFEAQSDNAFRLLRDADGWGLQARWGGATHEIALGHDLRYHAPGWTVELDPKTFVVRKAHAGAAVPEGATLDLAHCAAMYALLRGLRDSAPHLPAAARAEAPGASGGPERKKP
jgi:putative selenate reductase